jgi:membrane protease YdiL (CAAX protease family)
MLTRFRPIVRRHPLAVFVTLAYGLSWLPWLWSPGGLLPAGPFLAALLVLVLVGGRPAVTAWLRKIVHWRVGTRWYALVLLGPPALTLAAVGLTVGTGATPLPGSTTPGVAALAGQFVVVLAWIGLGEEPAWRGCALPMLMPGRSAVGAALLVGVIHAVWHLPLFGVEYDLANGVPWALSVLSLSIVTAWMWLHTGGSLLLPMLLHAATNTVTFAWGWLSGPDQLRLWWIWAGLWTAAAVVLVSVTGPGLTRRPAPASVTPDNAPQPPPPERG